MKIWADHQKTSGEKTIKCPFCREDFGPIELLKAESRNAMGVPAGGRMDRHLNTRCQSCQVSPIEGKCYRYNQCHSIDWYKVKFTLTLLSCILLLALKNDFSSF